MPFNQKFLYKKCLKKPVLIILCILFSIYGFYSLETHYNASLRHVLSLISSASAEEVKEKKVLYWTCPMHPTVKMDKPGKCPICGMPLVPVYEKGPEIKKEEGTVTTKAKEEEVKEKKILHWTCGMHPSVKMDKPGKCPICGMDLVPVYKKGAGAEEAESLVTIELSERARKLAQVKTDIVAFESLTKDIYTVGLIEYDERLKTIVSAWIPGRIDKLFVDFTGTQVVKGESMVWIYSPDLVSTQEEYLLALETLEKVKESPFDEVINGAASLIEASKRRLLWWGIMEKQIEELTKNKKIKQHTVIYAPISGIVIEKKALEGQYIMQGEVIYTVADLSNVWMKANIYEYEMAWIKIGQEVEVTTPTYPGEAFIGRVSFIEPFLDDKTRSVKIRCNIPNHKLKLKPSMYVNARIRIPIEELDKQGEIYVSGLDYICPNHPEIKSSRPGICPEDNIPFIKKPSAQMDLVAAGSMTTQQGEIEYEYVCPMECHNSKKPGNCPKCGMKLEKRPISKTAQRFVYMCPLACMTSDKPGKCPDCKRQMGRWEVKEDLGIKVKKIEPKRRSIYACPMHPEVISDKPRNCDKCGMNLEKTTQALAIPATAVLDTGVRKIVYLDKGNGQYVGKEVTLGPKAGDYYPVLEGLEEGDKVVTSANFLIDSQSQLTGGASALYGGAMEFKEEK